MVSASPVAGSSLADGRYMGAALALARRNLGCVWPNPAVGCLLVREGVIVGRGWTQRGGRPHAETEALRQAADEARGATAYVTLEPCAHRGETPPCADALIAASIARAVIALEDPDPRVSGRGIARLRAAGIAVDTGVSEAAAAELNRGFLIRCTEGRPLITVKLATSLDGRIATGTGDSRWITGDQARRFAHRLRYEHDAVMVGSGTAIADDPELTCRLSGLANRSLVRIVADGRLRLPPASRLAATCRNAPTWVLTRADAPADRRSRLEALGVRVIDVATGDGGDLDPRAIALTLGALGLTRVMIEGGGTLVAAFLAAGLVDGLAWFHAPRVLGADALPAARLTGIDRLADAPAFVRREVLELGEDVLETYARSR